MLNGIPFTTVLFDLDGTLVDSKDLILDSYRHTMREHLGEAPPDALWLATMGRPLHVQLRDFARDEEEAARMVATYRAYNHTVHDDLIRPFPGMRELVDRCRRAGIGLGIVTSKHSLATGMGLQACGLPAEWFTATVTSDTVERHKPHPEPVLSALAALGVEVSREVLFVGDSVHDLHAGREAGVSTAAALWGPYRVDELAPGRPDFWVESVAELGALLLGATETA